MHMLAFDGDAGASGDMLLGALLAAGADSDALEPVEDALDVRYEISSTERRGIAATAVDVVLASDDGDAAAAESGDGGGHTPDSAAADHGHTPDSADGPGHSHDHDEGHDHSHDHDHGHHHARAEGAGPERTYAEVVELVESMDLPDAVESDALGAFEILGEAEASVHGTDLDATHFHEVGADDAVADVVGACLLVDDLDPDRVVTTPLAAGGGTVEMSHGTYPVPAPAVVEIAERADWSLRGGPVDSELLTPTGAAILARLAEGADRLPPLRVAASGYGAGDRDLPDRPNVLRALVGEGAGRLERGDVTVLETNLDDASPEVLGSLQETLADAGARDVSVVPLTMKKSRPGHLVKVVAKPADAERVARRLAVETGTLGVRAHPGTHRWVAAREFETVTLRVDGDEYEVAVKVASDDAGEAYDVSAEYDDALAAARETGRPVREILRRAEERARDAE